MTKKFLLYFSIGILFVIIVLFSCSKEIVDNNQSDNKLESLNLRTIQTNNPVQFDIQDIENQNVVRVMFFLEHNKTFKDYMLGELGRLKLLSTIDIDRFNGCISKIRKNKKKY